MTTKEYLDRRKSPTWNFPAIVEKGAFNHVNKIHPLKQKEVEEIVKEASKDKYVNKIIIFGSSTRYDCDVTSDLDLCIDWTEDCYDENGVLKPFTRNMRRTITNVTSGNADVLNYRYLSDTEIEEEVKKGIVVYEHNV